jgi:hypothetical protein
MRDLPEFRDQKGTLDQWDQQVLQDPKEIQDPPDL